MGRTTKHNATININNTDYSIQLCNERDYNEYTNMVSLLLYQDEQRIAEMRIRIFNLHSIIKDGMDIQDIADEIDGDTECAINTLINNIPKYSLGVDGAKKHHYGYIEHLFVYPEHRQKGIGTHLLDKIEQILHEYYQFNVKTLTIFEYSPEEDDIENVKQRKIQAHTFEKTNFTKIPNNVWMKRS